MSAFGVAKGKRAERSVASALNPILESICIQTGVPVLALRRNLKQTQEGGHDLDGLDWLSIEIKHHNEIAGKLNSWWAQTLRQAGEYSDNGVVKYMREPVLIYKSNGTRWRVMMFGRLEIEPGRKLRVPVTIEWDNFLIWFRKRCEVEVKRNSTEGLFGSSSLYPGSSSP